MPHPFSPVLLTDLYALTMLQAYFDEAMSGEAVFSLFVRRLPARRNFLLACGLDDALAYLESLRFDQPALAYLDSLGRFSSRFLQHLERFRFTGQVDAVPEGTPVFANEPMLEVSAPIAEAQLIETRLLNEVHLQTLLASKALRIVAAAGGRQVIDFGLRRMHGIESGLKAARAFHIAGVDATSNVAAGQVYGIGVAGTMAHSYIQAHDDEYDALRAFARVYPDTVLLVDTYDTVAGIEKVIALRHELGSEFRVSAVRLDSGDLLNLSVLVRKRLDDAGLHDVGIFASSNLDEATIVRLVSAGAPITGFGVGAEMGISPDAPSLDMVYKLVEYADRGRVKLSPEKTILPGRKQIFRVERDGAADHDVVARHDEAPCGRPLLGRVMQDGVRLPAGRRTLAEICARRKLELALLPDSVRSLQPATYRVEVSARLTAELEALKKRASPT
jgi:nicotinate phosphoribosyltransferase